VSLLLLGLLGAALAEPEAIYMIMVDRFANGEPANDADADPADPRAFHGGDLAGIEAHLDHIQELGFTQIWLSPLARMRTAPIGTHGAFHGYWMTDGSSLEPRFGTAKSWDKLQRALQERQMVPVLDMVTNHVAPDSLLTRTHPDWFHGLGDVVDWSDPVERITHDVHGLPDLAQERPGVTDHLIAQAKHWRSGAAPIRLDAVRHLPPDFVRRYRAALSSPGAPAIIYGEIFEGNPVRLAREAERYGLDHSFDFPLHYALVDVFCRDGDARQLATVLSADASYAPGHTHLSFLDNHDLPRIRSACGGDEDKVAAAMELMLTLRGIPVVTYGTESGLQGTSETEARGDMDFSRKAPVAATIRQGLARRRSRPLLQTAPTLVGAATKDSLVLIRPGSSQTLIIRWSRTEGVRLEVRPGPPRPPPVEAALIPLQVPQVPLGQGESLWLSGSSAALGGWDPRAALGPLQPGGSLDLPLPWGSAVATKLLIKQGDGTARWADGDNQLLVLGLVSGHPGGQKLWWPAP
jgi:glycosidase